MAGHDWQGDVSILALDIAGYSRRDNEGQLRAKELLTAARQGALRDRSIPADETRWQDAGDGGYQMLRGDARRALDVLEQFVARVVRENADRIPERRIELRYALHYGKVHEQGADEAREYVGDGLNDSARLLDGMKQYAEPVGRVVASGAYRGQVLAFGNVEAELFTRLRDIVDKRKKSHEVWNVRKLPGYGREVAPEDLHRP